VKWLRAATYIVTQTNDPMGILKVSMFFSFLPRATLVTQTNDPMGILKVLVDGDPQANATCYTDQRSDGDTERSAAAVPAAERRVVTQTNDPMGILKE